jgi:hypothetical protein
MTFDPRSMTPWKAAASVSLPVVSLVILFVQLLAGDVHPWEVLAGAVVGVGFFLVSNLMVAWCESTLGLKTALLYAYSIKISVLLGVGLLLGYVDLDRESFGIALASAGCSYVVALAVFTARAPEQQDLQ